MYQSINQKKENRDNYSKNIKKKLMILLVVFRTILRFYFYS